MQTPGKREGVDNKHSHPSNPDDTSGLLLKGAMKRGRQNIQAPRRERPRRKGTEEIIVEGVSMEGGGGGNLDNFKVTNPTHYWLDPVVSSSVVGNTINLLMWVTDTFQRCLPVLFPCMKKLILFAGPVIVITRPT